jgi:DNA-binding HxlR family transcriptional regulator
MQVTGHNFPAMRRKSIEKASCPIARSLERVGDWWTMLILRDALHGFARFEEFRDSLGVAPNILAARLTRLVEDGFLDKRQYSAHPPRYEYVPTQRGRDFRPVLLSLMAFGNKHFAPEGAMVEVINTKTGKPADIGVFDRATGLPIAAPDYRMVPGPAANARVKKRYAARKVEAGAA